MALLAATPRRKTCLPRTALIALLTVLGLLVAAPAGAQQARHVRLVIDETFTHAHLSEVCGTEILESREATLNVTILYKKEGLIAKEIDPAGGGTITYSAAATGNSVSFPFQTMIIDYGAGAEVGSTFTAKFVGLFGNVPGIHAAGGLEIITGGVVIGFDENGLPLLDFGDIEVLVDHVNRPSAEELDAAICGALTA